MSSCTKLRSYILFGVRLIAYRRSPSTQSPSTQCGHRNPQTCQCTVEQLCRCTFAIESLGLPRDRRTETFSVSFFVLFSFYFFGCCSISREISFKLPTWENDYPERQFTTVAAQMAAGLFGNRNRYCCDCVFFTFKLIKIWRKKKRKLHQIMVLFPFYTFCSTKWDWSGGHKVWTTALSEARKIKLFSFYV